jgi:hypothetical protein
MPGVDVSAFSTLCSNVEASASPFVRHPQMAISLSRVLSFHRKLQLPALLTVVQRVITRLSILDPVTTANASRVTSDTPDDNRARRRGRSQCCVSYNSAPSRWTHRKGLPTLYSGQWEQRSNKGVEINKQVITRWNSLP